MLAEAGLLVLAAMIMLRSNSANAPQTWKMSLPIGVVDRLLIDVEVDPNGFGALNGGE